MKKSVKKILGILCSLVMWASCVVDAAAKGVVAEPSKTVEEQISEIQNDDSLSAEMKEIMIAKLTYTGEDITPLSLIEGEVTNVLSNFPYYYQEGEYWCVPACAQMVIKYTTGTKSAQSHLAKDLQVNNNSGCTFSNIKGVLNSDQSSNPYVVVYKENVSLSTMKSQFSSVLHWHDAPAVYNTKPSTGNGYRYSMNYLHAVVVSGEYTDLSGFRIHDPIHNASIPSYYWLTSSGIYNGIVS